MTPAKVRLASVAVGKPETNVARLFRSIFVVIGALYQSAQFSHEREVGDEAGLPALLTRMFARKYRVFKRPKFRFRKYAIVDESHAFLPMS